MRGGGAFLPTLGFVPASSLEEVREAEAQAKEGSAAMAAFGGGGAGGRKEEERARVAVGGAKKYK